MFTNTQRLKCALSKRYLQKRRKVKKWRFCFLKKTLNLTLCHSETLRFPEVCDITVPAESVTPPTKAVWSDPIHSHGCTWSPSAALEQNHDKNVSGRLQEASVRKFKLSEFVWRIFTEQNDQEATETVFYRSIISVKLTGKEVHSFLLYLPKQSWNATILSNKRHNNPVLQFLAGTTFKTRSLLIIWQISIIVL